MVELYLRLAPTVTIVEILASAWAIWMAIKGDAS